MYALLKMRYKLRMINADDVWKEVDKKNITADQAVSICGPRPI